MTNIQDGLNFLSKMAIEAACSAGVGYCMARAFSIMNPVHGAVFCAVSIPVSYLVHTVTRQIFERAGSNQDSRFVGKVVSFVLSAAISGAVATAIGVPITLSVSLIMSIALVAGWVLVGAVTNNRPPLHAIN